MTIKQFERLNKSFEQLKKIDNDIDCLTKLAELISRGETEISLKLSVKDLIVKEEQPCQIADDESLFDFSLTLGLFKRSTKKTKDKAESSDYKDVINDSYAFRFIGILLESKNREKAKIIQEIEKLKA